MLTLLASLFLVGATVYDGTGADPISDAVIHVEDGRIICVGTRTDCPVPDGADTVDLSGHYITPGLVDAHVHFSQTGWLDGRPDNGITTEFYDYEALQSDLRANPDRWHRSYLCTGITAVYDVGGFPWTIEYEAQAENNPSRAHVRAAGPLITHANATALRALGSDTFLPMSSDEEALAGVDQLAEWGAHAVKVWYLNPPQGKEAELDARLVKVGEAARGHGLPLIVHATQLRNAKAALRAGAKLLVHSVDDQAVDDEFLQLAKANNTVYAPTLMVSKNWSQAMTSVMTGNEPAIDDPNACVDPETRARIADTPEIRNLRPEGAVHPGILQAREQRIQRNLDLMMQNLNKVYEAGITIATATDAGNPLTLHGPSIYVEMEAMEEAGIPPEVVIKLSTHNGAHTMGRLDDFGTLEAGKIANLIVLTEDPGASTSAFRSIQHVMRMGEMKPVSHFSQ